MGDEIKVDCCGARDTAESFMMGDWNILAAAAMVSSVSCSETYTTFPKRKPESVIAGFERFWELQHFPTVWLLPRQNRHLECLLECVWYYTS